jgi:hypothetical protein
MTPSRFLLATTVLAFGAVMGNAPAAIAAPQKPAASAKAKAVPKPVPRPAARAEEDQSFLYLNRPIPGGKGDPANYVGLSNSRAASPISPLMLGQDYDTWLQRP